MKNFKSLFNFLLCHISSSHFAPILCLVSHICCHLTSTSETELQAHRGFADRKEPSEPNPEELYLPLIFNDSAALYLVAIFPSVKTLTLNINTSVQGARGKNMYQQRQREGDTTTEDAD